MRTNSIEIRGRSGFRAALLIREINALLNTRIAESLHDSGLTLPQLIAIKAIAHKGRLTLTELSRELCASKSTTAGIVDRLERSGLLIRLHDSDDKREVHIGFAPESEGRIHAIRTVLDRCFVETFSALGDKALAELESSLEHILGTVGSVKIKDCAVTDDAEIHGRGA